MSVNSQTSLIGMWAQVQALRWLIKRAYCSLVGYPARWIHHDSESDDDTAFYGHIFAGLVYNVSDTFEVFGGARYIFMDDVLGGRIILLMKKFTMSLVPVTTSSLPTTINPINPHGFCRAGFL